MMRRLREIPCRMLARTAVQPRVLAQVAQAQNMSIGEHRHCCVTFKIKGFVWGKKTYRFCNLRE